MKQMSSSFRIVNLEFFLNEDKVINDKISDPLKFIRFETALVFIPCVKVLSNRFTKLINMIE